MAAQVGPVCTNGLHTAGIELQVDVFMGNPVAPLQRCNRLAALKGDRSSSRRLPQSAGQLNLGLDADKGFGCQPLRNLFS